MDGVSTHWEDVYQRKSVFEVSWYREHLDLSLSLLQQSGLGPGSRVIDVGGGASTLVDDLLDHGVRSITVLDLSTTALARSQARLGDRAANVRWWVADATSIDLPVGEYSHWHDRAVLHFLSTADQVERYARQAARALMPGGHAVIGGFAPDGPERCSGLPVTRRSPQAIAQAMGPEFVLVAAGVESHRTPVGTIQSFAYAVLRRHA